MPKEKSPKIKELHIRLSPEEKKQLQANAKMHGCTQAELIRKTAIRSGKINPIMIDTKPLESGIFELQKQGNNLNQLMKFLNTHGIKGYECKRVAYCLDQTESAVHKIDLLLTAIRDGKFTKKKRDES